MMAMAALVVVCSGISGSAYRESHTIGVVGSRSACRESHTIAPAVLLEGIAFLQQLIDVMAMACRLQDRALGLEIAQMAGQLLDVDAARHLRAEVIEIRVLQLQVHHLLLELLLDRDVGALDSLLDVIELLADPHKVLLDDVSAHGVVACQLGQSLLRATRRVGKPEAKVLEARLHPLDLLLDPITGSPAKGRKVEVE